MKCLPCFLYGQSQRSEHCDAVTMQQDKSMDPLKMHNKINLVYRTASETRSPLARQYSQRSIPVPSQTGINCPFYPIFISSSILDKSNLSSPSFLQQPKKIAIQSPPFHFLYFSVLLDILIIIRMKFVLKKETRWLVFLLLPFICMLIIHVLTPLLFITQSNPLLQATYNIDKKTLEFRTIYAFQQINQQILSQRLSQYYRIFQNIQAFIQPQTFKGQVVDTSKIIFNNAYLFGLNNTSTGYYELVSMWFAPNCTDYSQLSTLQQEIYQSYAAVQPYLRALIPSINTSSLIGIKTFLFFGEQTMAFQYPSQYQSEFSSLNNSAFPDTFRTLIANYLSSSKTMSAFMQEQVNQTLKMSLCTVLLDQGNPYGVSCLLFDLQKFARQMYEVINFVHSDYFSISYYLMVPLIDNNKVYIRCIRVNTTGGYAIADSSSLNGPANFTINSSSNPKLDVRILSNGSSNSIFSPLIIQDNTDSLLYLMSRNSFISTSVTNSELFDSKISLTVGLICALIALASIVSIVIMKKIMNSLDQEMIQLSNYCTFIVQDDINIQIPVYNGTKDIRQVYQKVRIINKLNKYSYPTYFTGHYVDKILSYCQAQRFLHQINYQTGALLENIGNCYFYMQEVDKTIEYYKESVRHIMTKIRKEFGTIDEMFEIKQKYRLPKQYREYEIILIRRLFNLIESYNCLLECQLSKHIIDHQNQLIKDIFDYFEIFKKAVYPDFHLYAEFILVQFYEVKIRLHTGSFQTAKRVLSKTQQLCEAYTSSYIEVGKKLKEKGSKYKLLHLKNRITSHSRMHPDKIKTFRCYFKAIVLLADPRLQSKYQALRLLFEGTKVGIFSNRLTWMIFKKIHRILEELDVNEDKLFTLAIYNQICLLTEIKEKQGHAETCLYRYPSDIPKQERQYVFAVDSLANKLDPSAIAYFRARSSFIFQKLIKNDDRISIIKYNTLIGTKVECNLTLKESKEEILRREIFDSFEELGSFKIIFNQIFQAFEKIVHRIMRLRSEKVVLIWLQKLSNYRDHVAYQKKKEKSRARRQNSQSSPLDRERTSFVSAQFQLFGDWIISVIRSSSIKKCKICLFCSQNDKLQEVRDFFGLSNLNKKLQRQGQQWSYNWVYLLANQHKSDIQRILSRRVYSVPDNHIFIL